VLVERQTLWITPSCVNWVGGYTLMRHNSVRNSKAQIMKEVYRDIQTEHTLLPINENDFERKVTAADNAKLDISTRGV